MRIEPHVESRTQTKGVSTWMWIIRRLNFRGQWPTANNVKITPPPPCEKYLLYGTFSKKFWEQGCATTWASLYMVIWYMIDSNSYWRWPVLWQLRRNSEVPIGPRDPHHLQCTSYSRWYDRQWGTFSHRPLPTCSPPGSHSYKDLFPLVWETSTCVYI